jgi:hypothetical protein
MRARRAVLALSIAGAFALANGAPASAGNLVWEQSVRVNGVVKAHGVYYQSGRTYCVNLLNAPNVGAYARTQLVRENGQQVNTPVLDSVNDGARVCYSLHSSWQGTWLKMITTFRNANGG